MCPEPWLCRQRYPEISLLAWQVMMWEWKASQPSSSATPPTWRTELSWVWDCQVSAGLRHRTMRENVSSMIWPSLPRRTWVRGAELWALEFLRHLVSGCFRNPCLSADRVSAVRRSCRCGPANLDLCDADARHGQSRHRCPVILDLHIFTWIYCT